MNLASTPDELACAECDESFEEGYLPAVETDGGDACEPRAEAAVCTACGFNEVGYAGCAPEVDDLVDAEGAVLLHVVVDDGIEVRSVKE